MRVLLDADVLHRANVRDLLLRLAARRLFQPHWSAEILRELAASLARRHLTVTQIRNLTTKMQTAFPDAAVLGHEPLAPSLTLPDPNDTHVLAAAIVGRCDLIVTYNSKDFPAAALEPFGIEALHPDSFLMDLLHARRETVLATVRAQHGDLVNPPIPFPVFVAGLRAQGLNQLADALG